MIDRQVLVYADVRGTPQLVGRLWGRRRRDRDSATFAYDERWLTQQYRFALEPALQLGLGPHHTQADQPLFGALGDSAPDRWGRVLMRRAERRQADAAGRPARTLRELDYLLGVDDEARQGCLRFRAEEGGSFLAEPGPMRIPPLITLPRLLMAAEHVLSETETDEDLRLLLAPGSSLGGARPKASVRDRDGALLIAKFPKPDDELDVVRWEALALGLATRAGISVPAWRLESTAGRPVLLLSRFDRAGDQRHPYLSAMSMLGARDLERRSYLELADALRQHGAAPQADLQELWRRMVFSILISNVDDHLRNHGFLWLGQTGWRLSPAFDLNPVPIEVKPRVLSTAITLDDATASLATAFSVANYFELEPDAARRIAAEVGAAAASWRSEAARLELPVQQIERMASAFEHADLREAISARS